VSKNGHIWDYLITSDISQGFGIITIGKTVHFVQLALLRRFCQIWSSFHFFGFRKNYFLRKQGRQSCFQPPTWRTRSLYLCPPVTGWPSCTPQTPDSIFVSFYDSQGFGAGIPTRLHMDWILRKKTHKPFFTCLFTSLRILLAVFLPNLSSKLGDIISSKSKINLF
jgi:hypothetical protein